MRVCADCGVSIAIRRRSAVRCSSCSRNRAQELAKPHKAIGKITRTAIRVGYLKDPKTMDCVDCGGQATCYDHRDYNKPLEVVAVCSSCNVKRGPGIPLARALHELNTKKQPA